MLSFVSFLSGFVAFDVMSKTQRWVHCKTFLNFFFALIRCATPVVSVNETPDVQAQERIR